MDDVQQIIAKLHITKKYGGYYYSIMGIRILLDNPDRRLRITKDMYPPIAAKYTDLLALMASITSGLLLPFPIIPVRPRFKRVGVYLSILLDVVGPAEPIT